MPKYFYTAKSLKGEKKSGILEAKDTYRLSRTLRSQGLILIKAMPAEEKKEGKFKIPLSFGGVSLTEKMFFIRNLQIMIAAGLPLPRAIGSLSEQVKNPQFRKALSDIREEVAKGKSLSDSMARHPNIFSELFQSMIKVGEESGTLEKVLGTLALQMEKEHTLKSKIKGAMVYPAVIISAMLGVGILMLITVIPKLAETFKELNMELPLSTKFVIGLGVFLSQNWHLTLIGLLFLIIASVRASKIEPVKKVIDKLFLKIPIIAPIVRGTNTAHMARTLSSLIAAGTSLPRALEITSGAMGNFYFKKSLAESAEKVRKGAKLSEILKPYAGVYPLIIIQMLAVGEETGETSGILAKLADFFEEEVSNATKNLASVIEPILMLIIGVVIGFFAVSMIQPMYSMLGGI